MQGAVGQEDGSPWRYLIAFPSDRVVSFRHHPSPCCWMCLGLPFLHCSIFQAKNGVLKGSPVPRTQPSVGSVGFVGRRGEAGQQVEYRSGSHAAGFSSQTLPSLHMGPGAATQPPTPLASASSPQNGAKNGTSQGWRGQESHSSKSSAEPTGRPV